MQTNTRAEDQPSDTVVDEPLAECDVCGCTGVAERVDPENHDCTDFLTDAELAASEADPAPDRRLDLDRAYGHALPGATVIFAPTYTHDGPIKRYGEAVPIGVAGLVSPRDVRTALADRGYTDAQIDRAFGVELSQPTQQAFVAQAERRADDAVTCGARTDSMCGVPATEVPL